MASFMRDSSMEKWDKDTLEHSQKQDTYGTEGLASAQMLHSHELPVPYFRWMSCTIPFHPFHSLPHFLMLFYPLPVASNPYLAFCLSSNTHMHFHLFLLAFTCLIVLPDIVYISCLPLFPLSPFVPHCYILSLSISSI